MSGYPGIFASSTLIFANIWGPSPMMSMDGYRYYINFVDVMTNYN